MNKKTITPEWIDEASDMVGGLRSLRKSICKALAITEKELMSNKRDDHLVNGRHSFVMISGEQFPLASTEIISIMIGRDRSTLNHYKRYAAMTHKQLFVENVKKAIAWQI